MKSLLTLTFFFSFSLVFSGDFGAISGRVVDSVTGNPIAGANVLAMMRHNCGGRAVTNQNGEYTIPNLRPGFYRVTASASNYLRKVYPDPVLVEAGQTTENINFALAPYQAPPGSGSISGRVVDSVTGNPIVSANVSACGPSCGHAFTGENGEYLIESLLPGEYRVTARARGYLPRAYPERVVVYANQTTPNINFALPPYQTPPPPPGTGSISGRVVDKTTGEPIAGAIVSARRRARRGMGRAITGQDGTYRIENLPAGEYQVSAMARGYEPQVYFELVIVRENQNTPDINFFLNPRSNERERNRRREMEKNCRREIGIRKEVK